MWYVYILQCEDGSLYTGVTTDIQKRFQQHFTKNGGHYTSSHQVQTVVYTEAVSSQSEALKRERQIKGWRREKKLHLIKFGKAIG